MRKATSRRRARTRARLPVTAAAGLGVAATTWAAWIEPRRLITRRAEVTPARWPTALDGLRVGLVSDLHSGGPHVGIERVSSVVCELNARAPDLTVLLGDYVDGFVAFGGTAQPEAVARELGALRAPLGVYAVLGNHDWINAGRDMGAALRAAGVVVLENEALRTPHDEPLWIAGLADSSEREPDVAATFRGVPSEAAVLALSHDPDLFADIGDRAALTLAGHSHGGQVGVPWLQRRVISSDHAGRYAHGLVCEGDRRLFVTSGVGESGYPVRLLAPPEVVLLTLRAQSRQSPLASA